MNNSPPLIIGLGYQKRVGKDTACKFLMSHFRQQKINAHRLSFADEIKNIAYQMYSWGGLQDRIWYDEHPEDIETILPPIGKSPREIWDHVGYSEHKFCSKVWCEITFSKLHGDVVIIPSVRRRIEIDYIRNFGGKVFKIIRDGAPKSEHPVDHMLDDFNDWNGVIINNGTLKDFYSASIKTIGYVTL